MTVGVTAGGAWQEVLNSDSELYGGSGVGNLGRIESREAPMHGRPFSIYPTLPPLGILLFAPEQP